MIAWLLRRWPWAGAMLLAAGVAVRVWLSRSKAKRAIADANARAEHAAAGRDLAEAERDQARGEADIAAARARVATEAAHNAAAAERAAERIRDVPLTDDSAADRARLYDALRVLPPPRAPADDHDP